MIRSNSTPYKRQFMISPAIKKEGELINLAKITCVGKRNTLKELARNTRGALNFKTPSSRAYAALKDKYVTIVHNTTNRKYTLELNCLMLYATFTNPQK